MTASLRPFTTHPSALITSFLTESSRRQAARKSHVKNGVPLLPSTGVSTSTGQFGDLALCMIYSM